MRLLTTACVLQRATVASYGLGLADPTLVPAFRRAKERLCYVAAAALPPAAAPSATAEFGSGRVLEIAAERWQAAEELFSTVLHGQIVGLPAAVVACLQSCDISVRSRLAARVFLAGGTACLPGLPARLQAELEAQGGRVVTAGATRKMAAWAGGAELGASEMYDSCAIEKEEWEEQGDRVFGR